MLALAGAAIGQDFSSARAAGHVLVDDTQTNGPLINIDHELGPQIATSGASGSSPLTPSRGQYLTVSQTNAGWASVHHRCTGSTGEFHNSPGSFGIVRANGSIAFSYAVSTWRISGPPNDPRTHVPGRIRWEWFSEASYFHTACPPPARGCVSNCSAYTLDGFIQVVGPGLGYVDDARSDWSNGSLTSGQATGSYISDQLMFPVGQGFDVTLGARMAWSTGNSVSAFFCLNNWGTGAPGRPANGNASAICHAILSSGPGMNPTPVMELPEGFTVNSPGAMIVDNIYVGPPAQYACYADCDPYDGPGVLDIFDFLCFQSRFAVGDPYACDCDNFAGPGLCDIFDFLCYQNAYLHGCE